MQLPMFCFSRIINGLLKITVVSFGLLIGCHADDYTEQEPIRVTVTGTVIDAVSLAPLDGVSVRSDNNAVIFVTKANGLFLLENVSVNKIGEVIITFSKDGYPSNQKVFVVEQGKTYSTQLALQPYGDIRFKDDPQVSKEVIIDKPAQDTTIEVPGDPDNPAMVLVIPAGSLSEGTDPNNPLTYTVKATVLDPTDLMERRAFPGFFLSAPFDFFRPDALLESVVFMNISITDSAGLRLASLSNPATYYLKLPDDYQAGGAREGTYIEGSSVQWWVFRDTRGHWGEESFRATITSVVENTTKSQLYVKVSTSALIWSTAGPNTTDLACLGVSVVDHNGLPLRGAVLVARGTSYDGNSLPVITDANGFARVLTKPSSDLSNPERVTVWVSQGILEFPLDVVDAGDGDETTNEVTTSSVANSYVVKDAIAYGDCKNLVSKLVVDLSGTVEGQLTFLGSGNPALNHPVHTDVGVSTLSDETGWYTFRSPQVMQETFYVFSSIEFVERPFFDPNTSTVRVDLTVQTPIIDSLTRSIGDPVEVGTEVTLTVFAKDLEEPSLGLQYVWTSLDDLGNDIGTINDPTLSTITWIAPATGTGVANLKVVVDNLQGGNISQTVIINYEETPPL